MNQTLVDRSRHPVRFTREGEVFHQEAFEILNRLSQARSALEDPDLGARNHVDVLMPHILSASRFSRWWQQWSDGTNLTVSASVGNITEMVSRFIAGGADLLICHSGEDLPMILDSAQYKSHLLELDRLSPYMALKLRRQFPVRAESGKEEMMSRTWIWRQKAEATPDDYVLKVTIDVRLEGADEDNLAASVTGFIAKL